MPKVEIDIVGVDKLSPATKSASTSLQGLATITTGLNSALAIGARVIDQVGKAYNATVGAAQAYDQQVKDLMTRTGGNAEATSRLIQVLDDAGIEYGTLEQAMKFAVKNGIEPNVQSLAKLSDKYLKLNTNVEKGQFLMDTFGKSGLDMARAMELGGDTLLQMNGAVEKNLVLTEEQIRQSEEYRKNLDDLSDSWTGLKVRMGNDVIPVLNDMVTYTNLESQAIENLTGRLGVSRTELQAYQISQEIAQIKTIATRDAVNAHADALNNDTTAIENNNSAMEIGIADMTEAQAQAYLTSAAFLTMMGDIFSQSPAMQLSLQNLNNDLATGKITTQQYAEQVRKLYEQLKRIDGMKVNAILTLQTIMGSSGSAAAVMNAEGNTQNQHHGGAIGDGYANGGSFVVPNSYGTEGFNMGGMATASGGETVTVSRGGRSSGGSVNITYAPMFSTANKNELMNALRPMLDEWYRGRLTA